MEPSFLEFKKCLLSALKNMILKKKQQEELPQYKHILQKWDTYIVISFCFSALAKTSSLQGICKHLFSHRSLWTMRH